MPTTAYIIKVNDHPMAVVLDNHALARTEQIALGMNHYNQVKSQYADFKQYCDAYVWSFQVLPVTTTITKVGALPPERTHVPESFPAPQQSKLPGQAQLKRVQLPTSAPATTASTHSHPAPGVAGVIKDQVRARGESFVVTPPTPAAIPLGVKCPVCEATGQHLPTCPEVTSAPTEPLKREVKG